MSQQVDRVNFGLTVAVLLGMSVPLLTFPEQSAALLRAAYAWIAETFGWLYILTGAVALIDNYQVMHGRRPFSGRRSVLASLCLDWASA